MLRMNWLRLAKLPLVLFILAACPNEATTARECEPNTSRCSADRRHAEVCLSTGRWRDTNPMEPCAEGTACCLAVGIAGRPIHQCVLIDEAECLPESTGQPTYAPPADPAPVTTKAASVWSSGGPGSPVGAR